MAGGLWAASGALLTLALVTGVALAVRHRRRPASTPAPALEPASEQVTAIVGAAAADAAASAPDDRSGRGVDELAVRALASIVMKAEALRRFAGDRKAVAREAGDIEAIGRIALAGVRDAVAARIPQPRLAAELDAARAALREVGVSLRVRGADTIPPPVTTLFGWAVHEAVTNVVRHSGARTCTIAFSTANGTTMMTVSDDGRGVAAVRAPGKTAPGKTAPGKTARGAERVHTGGVGLRQLQERFAGAGGTVSTSSRPGRGFHLVATVPVAP